jgi:23S rRNA (adenine-N6)-dimethyltransferase
VWHGHTHRRGSDAAGKPVVLRVMANPPFANASPLVRTLLRSPHLLSADLVMQRGAVRGLLSRAPARARRHALSAGRPVPRRASRPAPKVDSTVLQI